MVGDGLTTCDLPKYETQLTLSQPGTTIEEFDEAAFKSMLYSTGVIPSTINPDNVYVSATEGGSGGARRRLLSSSSDDGEPAASAAPAHDSSVGSPAPIGATSPVRRHLLQAGDDLQIKVSIYSSTEDGMSNVTSAINVSVLQGTGFVVLALPTSYVNPYQV